MTSFSMIFSSLRLHFIVDCNDHIVLFSLQNISNKPKFVEFAMNDLIAVFFWKLTHLNGDNTICKISAHWVSVIRLSNLIKGKVMFVMTTNNSILMLIFASVALVGFGFFK